MGENPSREQKRKGGMGENPSREQKRKGEGVENPSIKDVEKNKYLKHSWNYLKESKIFIYFLCKLFKNIYIIIYSYSRHSWSSWL